VGEIILIDSISGLNSFVRPPPISKMSESQKGTVQRILTEYNSENLSAVDAQSINEAFRAEGIRPSADLKSEIEAAGFDVSALRPSGSQVGMGNDGPPPPPPQGYKDESALDALIKILKESEYQAEILDKNALQEISEKFREAGFSSSNKSLISIAV
jgi:hypothetical protein